MFLKIHNRFHLGSAPSHTYHQPEGGCPLPRKNCAMRLGFSGIDRYLSFLQTKVFIKLISDINLRHLANPLWKTERCREDAVALSIKFFNLKGRKYSGGDINWWSLPKFIWINVSV